MNPIRVFSLVICGTLVLLPDDVCAGILAGPIDNPETGHSYYLLTENTWTSSEQEAVGLGGHLVTINNQREQDWVWAAFGNYGGVRRSLWIGLNDVADEGVFTWVSGETVTYLNWLPGQPDNNTPMGEDYVHMMGNDRDAELPARFYGKWNDYQNSDASYTSYNFGPLHGVVEVDHFLVTPIKSFLWQVDSGASRVYILGSIHVLRSADYPLPLSLSQAFSEAAKVYFETDLDEAASGSIKNYILARAAYPSGENLQSKLPAATYVKIQNFAQSHGLAADYFRPFRPWYVGIVVGNLVNSDLGALGSYGVDQHFFDVAKLEGLARAYLETPTQQVDFLADAPETESINSLVLLMDNPSGGALELIDHWKQGDTAAFVASNEVQSARSPETYSSIITTRNQNWMSTVTGELTGSKTTMFIVGAAHTVGTNGVPARLADLGYTVRQLPLETVRLLSLKAVREIPGIQTNEVDIPVVNDGASVSELPVLLYSKVHLVATTEDLPNVTNTWFRDGMELVGESGSVVDLGFPTAGTNPEYNLMVTDAEGQRIYNRVRILSVEPDMPELRVAPFTPSSGFQCFVSVVADRHYEIDVIDGFEPGNLWHWFGNINPTVSTEIPLSVIPWSQVVPQKFYRVMEIY